LWIFVLDSQSLSVKEYLINIPDYMLCKWENLQCIKNLLSPLYVYKKNKHLSHISIIEREREREREREPYKILTFTLDVINHD